jgi:two-component system response regulator TctD
MIKQGEADTGSTGGGATAVQPAPRLRVLIVESSDEIRKRLVRLANDLAGIDAESVDSPEAALALLRRSHFHVIVLDLDLPGRQGFEALSAIRTAAQYSVLIVLCSDGSPEVAERCHQLGADFQFVMAREFSRFRNVLAALARGPGTNGGSGP